MVDQIVSRLVFKLDDVMADAGYARVETTAPGIRDIAQLHEIIATVHPDAHLSVQGPLGTGAGRRVMVYSYRDHGATRRPS